MITKEITICNKAVTLAYCYATEIAYKELAGEDIIEYALHAIDSIHQERDPDTKRTFYAILACLMAYYDAQGGKELPLKDTDLMNEAKPAEIGAAIITILELRAKFYHTPVGEPADDESAGTRKQGKGKKKN